MKKTVLLLGFIFLSTTIFSQNESLNDYKYVVVPSQYSFLKEVNGKPTLVVVDATDLDYITVINPTTSQLDNLIESGNFGLDTRPSLQLTLRLRGPGTNGN